MLFSANKKTHVCLKVPQFKAYERIIYPELSSLHGKPTDWEAYRIPAFVQSLFVIAFR
jgi:hypothetical protein